MSKMNKTQKLEALKATFDQVLPEHGTQVVEDIVQEIYRMGLTPSKDLFDKIISRESLRRMSPGQLGVTDSPPPMEAIPFLKKESGFFDAAGNPQVDISEWDAKVDGPDGEKIPMFSAKEKNKFAQEICELEFRFGKFDYEADNAGFTLLKVEDLQTKTASARPGSESAVTMEACNTLSRMLALKGAHADHTVIKDILTRYKMNAEVIGKDYPEATDLPPVLNSYNEVLRQNSQEEQWNTYYSRFVPDSSVPCPNIKSVLARMTEGDAVAALIWGIYSEQYKGRQVLWLYGAAGEEGKSYLIKAIGHALYGCNAGYKAISASSAGKKSFDMGNFIGSRLIVYADCNNPAVLHTEFAKLLSGGGRDDVVAEVKYKPATTATIDGRLIIISNKLPKVVNANWYLSRLLFCEISSFEGAKDPFFDQKILAEMDGFLAYAKDCYEKLCPDHEEIKLTTMTKTRILGLLPNTDTLFQDSFETFFEFGVDSDFVSIKDLKTILSEDLRNRSDWLEFIRWMEEQGLEKVRRAVGFGYKGMKTKAFVPANKTAGTTTLTLGDNDYDKFGFD